MVSLRQLFEWFTTGKFPSEAQFAEQFKSFWHKSEKLPIDQIFGLKEEIEKVTTKFKGYHTSLSGLQTAYPQNENKKDFFAWVGSPFPGTVWKVYKDGGSWTDTGEVPTQEEIDLSEYAKLIRDDGKKVVYSDTGEIPSDLLSVDDIYQTVDDISDKPISPKGVKDGIISIEGLGYRETSTPPTFDNVITSYNYKSGYYLDKDVEKGSGSYIYNQDYFPVKPSTKYLHSNQTYLPAVLFYTEDKTFISQVNGTLGGSFTTPANAAYIRYNTDTAFNFQDRIYVYEEKGAVVTSDKLGVVIGVGDIVGAKKTDVSINTGNIIPEDVVFADKALDNKEVPNYSGWYHTETYIPIEGGIVYDTNLTNSNPLMWFYDSEKRPISYIGTGATGLPFGTFTTPVNAAFCRFNTKVANASVFFIKKVGTDEGVYYIPNLVVPRENVIDIDTSTGEVVQVIPYADDGTSVTSLNYFTYANQDAIRGKYIDSIEVNMDKDNSTLIVAFSADEKGTAIIEKMTFTGLSSGKNTIEIGRKQGLSEYLCFNGAYKFNQNRANPVGGGIIGQANLPNADLCIGINALVTGGSGNKKTNYASLGDSITFGASASTPYSKLLSLKLGGSFNNYAVSGARCIGASGNVLINQVNNIPAGFKGFITIMIGINDVSGNSLPGDVSSVLAKSFDSLDANASFAEAFRLSLETTLRKAPDAKVLVILPLKAWAGQEAKIEQYRQIERDICEYFAIPYSEIFKTCTISPLTYATLMPDSLHPNDAGHFEIMRVLWGDVEKHIGYTINS